MSYDEANQVKFIQAHQIAKNTVAEESRPSAEWFSASEWWSWTAAPADRDDEDQVEEQLERARCPTRLSGVAGPHRDEA